MAQRYDRKWGKLCHNVPMIRNNFYGVEGGPEAGRPVAQSALGNVK